MASIASANGNDTKSAVGAATEIRPAKWEAGNDTFTCFPKLPIELRLRIWDYCHFPRIVDVTVCRVFDGLRDRYSVDSPTKYASSCRPPTVLSVCKESRRNALQHYDLEFGTTFKQGILTVTTVPHVYISPRHDTLCFIAGYVANNTFLDLADRFQQKDQRLRTVAVELRFLSEFGGIEDLETLPWSFRQAEELVLWMRADYRNGVQTGRIVFRDDVRDYQSLDVHAWIQNVKDRKTRDKEGRLVVNPDLVLKIKMMKIDKTGGPERDKISISLREESYYDEASE